MFPVQSWPNRKRDTRYAGNLGQYCLWSRFALQIVAAQEVLAVRLLVILNGKVKAKLGRYVSQILSLVIQGNEKETQPLPVIFVVDLHTIQSSFEKYLNVG